MGIFWTPRLLTLDGREVAHHTLFSNPITAYLGQGRHRGIRSGYCCIFFCFGRGLGLVDFFSPTEAAPSEIAHDAGRGVGKGEGSLGAANLRLGESDVMDLAAALVRDENN